MTNTITSPWMTPKEAAEYLKTTVRTLQHYRTKKSGPHYEKRGKVIRYNIEDLDRWMRGE